MITDLSPAQWAELALFRDKAYQRGSACGPTTRELVQPILTEFYQRIGRPAPRFEWLASPLACLTAYQAQWDQIGAPPKPQTWEQLKGQTWEQLEDQHTAKLGAPLEALLWGELEGQAFGKLGDEARARLSAPLEAQLKAQLWEQLETQLWEQLGAPIEAQLFEQAGEPTEDQLWGQLEGHAGDQVAEFFWGSHEKYWIAFYRFLSHLGVRYPRDTAHLLAQWDTLTDHCGWWLPYDHVCFVADRPVVQHVDAQYRLQNAHGPAMRFADGFAVWAQREDQGDDPLLPRP